MSLNLNLTIDGKNLVPTMRQILDSMGTSEKQKLAADIAVNYFKQTMQDGGAEAYLKELSAEVKASIKKRLLDQTDLAEKMDEMIEGLRPGLMDFVQNLVKQTVMEKIAEAFQEEAQK